jgi:branched-chain amino acid transport system permease protein
VAEAARRSWPFASLAVLVTVLTLIASASSPNIQQTAIETLIYLVAVVGLYIFAGNSGILSFGHVSFMAVGAYTSALLTMPAALKTRPPLDPPSWIVSIELPVPMGILVGGVVAALFAVVVVFPLMRLVGLAAGIATFALLLIVRDVVKNWDSMTAGLQTLVGVPSTLTLWGVLVWALLTMAAAHIYQETRSGLSLRASRDDEAAAAASGINIRRERRIAFVISAFFVGISGALFGHYLAAFGPNQFYITLTFFIIAMLVVGGLNSLAGAVVGTLTVSVVGEFLRKAEGGFDWGFVQFAGRPGLREVGLALLMLGILLFRPNGLTGGREVPPLSLAWLRARTPVVVGALRRIRTRTR